MRKLKFIGPAAIVLGIALLGVAGLVIAALWNHLMPPIFGLPVITFWQALGLLALSRILFGRIGGGRGGGMGPRLRKKLTPEERDRFGQAMGNMRGCGGEQ